MRKIDFLAIHNSDSDYPWHDNYESIYQWHVVENKWSDVGYHFLILKSGRIIRCRPVEKIGAHVFGYNKNSIGICLTGKTKFSSEQFESLNELVKELIAEFGLEKIDVLGHYELDSNKTCPNFNVKEKLKF